MAEQLQDSVPDTATFVAPLDGDGDDGVVGFFAASESTTGSILIRTTNSEKE